MTPNQLAAYDRFLDENDWDIYYWATQQQPPTSAETAEGGAPEWATPAARGDPEQKTLKPARKSKKAQPAEKPADGAWVPVAPGNGEWAQTVGTQKARYIPVPARWKNSEILSMLRRHVIDRSAGGVHEESDPKVAGTGRNQSVQGTGGGGMAFMPELKNIRQSA